MAKIKTLSDLSTRQRRTRFSILRRRRLVIPRDTNRRKIEKLRRKYVRRRELLNSNRIQIEEMDENSGDVNGFQDIRLENLVVDNNVNNPVNPVNLVNPFNGIVQAETALKNAFLSANLKHTQQKCILKTLRCFPFNLTYLPKDSRTLLKTPTVVVKNIIQHLAGGEYLHMGLEDLLIKKLTRLPIEALPDFVLIDFSTDGGQMYRSGQLQFWPIQFRILNIGYKRPMIAGVFVGDQKPSNPFDFFGQFVTEIEDISNRGGLFIRNQLVPLNIRCFIADAPARAFALNHYGHTSANACSKCKIIGYRCTVAGFERTMIFPGIDNECRTDTQYRALLDEDHHKGPCPLDQILGLVSRVPFEGMHLVYIGNTKKIFEAHVQGKYGFKRFNGRKLNILDARMALAKQYCPSDFNRPPGKLTKFHLYKATQFRQLLLYTAPAVLRDVFSDDHYQHFMLLHAVIRLLSIENPSEGVLTFCEAALRSYVTLCEHLYGEQFLSYNVHGLLHVVDDVRELGSFESYSAFCYENSMPDFRDLSTRKPREALAQYYKRMKERDSLEQNQNNNIDIVTSQIHFIGPLVDTIPEEMCVQFKKIVIGGTIFSTSLRNNCCMLRNSEICIIQNIIRVQEDIFFIVKKFRNLSSLYNVGYTSEFMGVYICRRLTDVLHAVRLQDVKIKCFRMPHWSNVEGREESVVQNEYVCATCLTPLTFPPL